MVEVGLGAAEAMSVPGDGRVVGVYPKAAYLRLPGGLMAVTTRAVPSGPVHLRADVDPSRLQVGDRVAVRPDRLEAEPVSIDRRGVTLWLGRLPPATTPLGLAVDVLERAPRSSVVDVVDPDLVRRGDLARLGASVGGLGPGLTPAGDDFLAGVFVVARLRCGPLAEGLAEPVKTNAVARMYLRWAARGQSIEPVHRLLLCAAGGDAEGASDALDALLAFGHSSGADLAFGLRLALELLTTPCSRAASGRTVSSG